MHREYFYSLVLLTTLIASNIAYNIEQPQLQLFANTYSLSIEDDPDIKYVQFNVNINKEFLEFENAQYKCAVGIPRQRRWSCEFERHLLDEDIVYTWISVQHNHLIYRARSNPFSVGAVRRGERNYILTTTSTTWSPLDSDNNIIAPTTQQVPKDFAVKISVPNQGCDSTITELLRNSERVCRDQLIFEDNFDQFNNEYWTNEIRIPSTRLDSEFVIYNGSVIAENGILKVTANLSNHGIYDALDLGERCTANNDNECRYELKPNYILPPITSGRINSAKYFNFKYGRIEVRAKVPKGDWLFPLITLQPTSNKYGSEPFANGEMRVAFVRGNEDLTWNGVNIGGARLFGGPIFSLNDTTRHQYMSNTTLVQANGRGGVKEHFGDQFHVYSLSWTTNELLLSVDGFEYGKIAIDFKDLVNKPSWRNGPSNVPLDQMFYITLGVAAGGHGDFPENMQNKPWENTHPKAIKNFYNQHTNWQATWTQPSLEVDYVRVYAI